MQDKRPKFPAYVQFFTWLFIAIYSLSPLAICYKLSTKSILPPHAWSWAVLSVIGLQIIFFYVQHRCSSEELSYWEGMNYTSYSMNAGTSSVAFFLILPSLSLLFVLSLPIALYGEVRRNPKLSQKYFYNLVNFFYKNRMVQW